MADPVDVEIGKNIRVFRYRKGMTQEELAYQVGVTFQQIQKYEKGMNRVSAARLKDISEILGQDITSFFQTNAGGKESENPRIGQLISVFCKLTEKQQITLINLAKGI